MESEYPSRFDQEETSKTCTSKLLLNILLIANFLAAVMMVVVVVYSYKVQNKTESPMTSNLDHLAKQYADALPDAYIPDQFRVSRDYFFPATDQASRGTCWAFAMTYLIETQYRAQGIRDGFLREDEYVPFSKQALAATLGNYCRSHPTVKVCQYGGFLNTNSTNDNQIEALPYFFKEIPELANSIVPESVCPYTTTKSPETDFRCDGLQDAIKSNPVKVEIVQHETVFDLRAVKQLLYKAQRPLGISAPLTTVDYYVPCTNPKYSNTQECVEKWTPCPDSKNREFCAVVQLKGRTPDGTFIAMNDQMKMTQFGGHAMNIVGYNDHWQYNSRLATPESIAHLKGTLILHNSWRADGHSIEYLMGSRTLENEESVCPNHNWPENWIPATLECMQENNGDASKCSTDIIRIRGQGRTHGADVLKCNDKTGNICDNTYSYVLARDNDDISAKPLDNGFYSIKLIKFRDGEAPTLVEVDTIPFWAIAQYLAPKNVVPNEAGDCGFYAMPYQAFEVFRRRNWDLFDNMKVSDIELKFSPSSYIKSPESRKFNTRFLNESTKRLPNIAFDGPIPFSVVYN